MTLLLKFVAECSRLIIGILALSAICNCDKDFNLTFYNESKTWSDAKDFCFANDGILEADKIIIKRYAKEHVHIWLGAYSMITPWAGVFGCYFWEDKRNKSIEFELQNKEECQTRCPQSKYEFFCLQANRDNIAICAENDVPYITNNQSVDIFLRNTEIFQTSLVPLFGYSVTLVMPQDIKEKVLKSYGKHSNHNHERDKLPHDDLSPNKCSDSTETDYVFIYKQNIGPTIDKDWNDTYNCITVECKNHGRDRFFTAENCDSLYNALCENMNNRSTINVYNASKFCENEDSFVRWDPSLSCSNSESFESKHWTSIKRSQQMSRLTAYDENLTLKPLQCTGLDTSGDMNTFVEPSAVNCTELRPFYCRYGSRPLISSASNESPGHNVTMELPDDSHTTRYLIPGAIAGTTLLAIVVGVVILVFRRRSAKRTSNLKHDAHRPINTEDIGNVNNQNRYSYSEVKVEGSNQHVNMIDNGDDQYTTGTSDVYDHLNENKNRKMKTENPHAIYDHAIGDNAEPDYDSTKHVVPTNPDYQEVRIGSVEESIKEKL